MVFTRKKYPTQKGHQRYFCDENQDSLLSYVENIGLSQFVCIYDLGGESHVRLGGDALHSTSKRCHSKTDGERETTSIHAPFTWECTPWGIYVALCGTNHIVATMLRVHSTNEKAG